MMNIGVFFLIIGAILFGVLVLYLISNRIYHRFTVEKVRHIILIPEGEMFRTGWHVFDEDVYEELAFSFRSPNDITHLSFIDESGNTVLIPQEVIKHSILYSETGMKL